jgi:hypothetical protein
MKRFNRESLETFSANHPIKLAVLIFLLAFTIITILSFRFYGLAFYENILVEAHGMLFDLLIIGVFVYWLNSLGERRQTIERYREEIEDYLGWQEAEATYRIVGNIRRLNREGVSDILLREANLGGADLLGVTLVEANLKGANLKGANLGEATLRAADLGRANLGEATLVSVDLEKADLGEANLAGANLFSANLAGANLFSANLKGTNLFSANLKRANLRGAYLGDTKLEGAYYNQKTVWPEGFNPTRAGAVFIEE